MICNGVITILIIVIAKKIHQKEKRIIEGIPGGALKKIVSSNLTTKHWNEIEHIVVIFRYSYLTTLEFDSTKI